MDEKGGVLMIDLHCHILPGVDDGAENEQAAIAMAREAVQQGITHIVATPHHRNRSYDNPAELIKHRVQALNQLIDKENIPLTILPGQEPRVFGEMVEAYHSGELLTLNESQYVFIEFPSNHVPRYSKQLIYDLRVEGLNPIIVHPERNSEIVKDPNILYEFVQNGALSQLTATSLVGDFGKKIKKFSLDCIEHSLSHFIASDAHNTTTRPFSLREAYDTIENEFGMNVRFLFQENAQFVIEDKLVDVMPPEPIKAKKFLGIF